METAMTAELLGLQLPDWERLNSILQRTESPDDFQVLGLVTSAGVKDVKRAYFEVAALVHPDRFFGKDIGPWKAKLERAYLRATKAHDALVGSLGRIAAADVVLISTRGAYDAQAAATARKPESDPAPLSTRVRVDFAPVSAASPGRAPSLDERRALLARKLSGGARPPPPAAEEATPPRASPSSPPQLTRADYESLMERAKKSAADNNWGQAFVYAQAASAFRGADAPSLVWCVEVALRANIPGGAAIDWGTRAVTMAPSLPGAHLAIAKAYEAAGRVDMAVRVADNGVILCAESPVLAQFSKDLKARAAKARR